jgi:hypothetical protein
VVTIVDAPTEGSVIDDAQLLFREAKQRRRRRLLIGWTASFIVVLLLCATAVAMTRGSGTNPPRPISSPVPISGASVSAASFTIRPVLCYAPPLTPPSGQPASTGPLPTCGSSFQLTAANLAVDPDSSNVAGFTEKTDVSPDPQFAGFASTSPSNDNADGTVLLPGTVSEGDLRYVLGPVGLSASGIKSARAVQANGQWAVNLVLTSTGSTRWDALARQQFHAIIGIVDHGHVISAPITQPTQSSFTSFNGEFQISGNFTKHQASALAGEL